MSTSTTTSPQRATRRSAPRPLGDRIFSIAAAAAGLLVLVILVLIALSTGNEARPWFQAEGLSGILSNNWDPANGHYGALAFIYGTLITATIAIVIAVPVSVGIALLVTEIVPRRIAQPIVWFIDL